MVGGETLKMQLTTGMHGYVSQINAQRISIHIFLKIRIIRRILIFI